MHDLEQGTLGAFSVKTDTHLFIPCRSQIPSIWGWNCLNLSLIVSASFDKKIRLFSFRVNITQTQPSWMAKQNWQKKCLFSLFCFSKASMAPVTLQSFFHSFCALWPTTPASAAQGRSIVKTNCVCFTGTKNKCWCSPPELQFIPVWLPLCIIWVLHSTLLTPYQSKVGFQVKHRKVPWTSRHTWWFRMFCIVCCKNDSHLQLKQVFFQVICSIHHDNLGILAEVWCQVQGIPPRKMDAFKTGP